jgi:hypothetical protein
MRQRLRAVAAAHNKFWDPVLTWKRRGGRGLADAFAVTGATSMTEGRVQTSMPWQRSTYFGLFMGRYA